MTAARIAFDAVAPSAEARAVRTFTDPRTAIATVTPVDPTTIATAPSWPEPTDGLLVLTCANRQSTPAGWLNRPDHVDATLSIEAAVEGGRLRWRPGRAVLDGRIAKPDEVLAGLVDFAFYEAELRQLETALPAIEATAAADVPFVYDVNTTGQPHWPRFKQTLETLATLRLTFARLEPRLGRASRAIPIEGRRAFARLCVRANIEDRLQAFSDRLEACEDLYEGAVDRVTDHRWWQKGHRLEMIIVGLLALEGLQLAIELALRLSAR